MSNSTATTSSMHREIMIAVLAAATSAILLIAIFACCYANKRKRQSETEYPPLRYRLYRYASGDLNSASHPSEPNQNRIAEL